MESRSTLAVTRCGNLELRWGERTYVMGILNVTPDSFSGDGIADDVGAGVARARQLVEEGADIIDVGGESTRPGTKPLSIDDVNEELRLVIPAIERLAAVISVPISIDTYKSAVARHALEAGAVMINDIWGLKKDPAIAGVAAAAGVPVILMANERDAPPKVGIMARVLSDLRSGIKIAIEAGVAPENIIVDPGIGFGKGWQHDLEIVRRLAELTELGKPILLGPSGKSFIGKVLDLPVSERLQGTAAAVAIGIAHGADMVRVHDVKPIVRVCRMSDAIIRRRQIGN